MLLGRAGVDQVQDARAEGGGRQQLERYLRVAVEQPLAPAEHQRVHQQVQFVEQALFEEPGTSVPLPVVPSCWSCLSLASSVFTSPLTTVEFSQVGSVSVVDTTYFRAPFI